MKLLRNPITLPVVLSLITLLVVGWYSLALADVGSAVIVGTPTVTAVEPAPAPMSNGQLAFMIVITALTALGAALHYIAPLTKNKWDDKGDAFVQALLARIAALETAHDNNARTLAAIEMTVLATPPNARLIAGVPAGSIVPDPTVTMGGNAQMPAGTTAIAKVGKPGFVSGRLMAITAGLALVILAVLACADVKKAGAAVVDCTKTNYQVAAVELAKCATWGCVYNTAIGFGATVGGCAFRALVDSGTLLAGSERSAKPIDGTAEFERFRSAIANGATYRTALGDK